METIFDFNPTDTELTVLLGKPVPRDEYIKTATDQDGEYAQIYRLLSNRGDGKGAEKYLRKIRDEQFRFDTELTDVVAVER